MKKLARVLERKKITTTLLLRKRSIPVCLPPIGPEHRIVILDWDDTLLPSTVLRIKQYTLELSQPIEADIKQLLITLDEKIQQFLNTILPSAYEIHIITNAQSNWVELSSLKFLPLTHDVLMSNRNKICITSARDLGEPFFPIPHSDMWKRIAFQLRLWDHRDRIQQIICIGDSDMEHVACKWFCAQQQAKSISAVCLKLDETPTISHMTSQIQWLTDHWSRLSSLKENVYSKLSA